MKTRITNPLPAPASVPKQKKVLVIGSGFHKEISSEKSILSDWNLLLKSLDPKIISEGNQTLAFEEIIVRAASTEEHSKLEALEIENIKLQEIAGKLDIAQSKIVLNEVLEQYNFLFDTENVSDIISLNFDTTLERLCVLRAHELGSKNKICKKKIHYKDKQFVIESYDILFPNGETIRIWYPHGSTRRPESLTLGVRSYFKRMSDVEEMRKLSKSKKHVVSWYHQFTHNPVILIGTSLSSLEWDLWFALVNRERNFAKKSNKKFRSDISMSAISMSEKQTTNFWINKPTDSKSYWSSIQKMIQSNTNS